jgi:diguanylate cyclase (GGDEF)-like protein
MHTLSKEHLKHDLPPVFVGQMWDRLMPSIVESAHIPDFNDTDAALRQAESIISALEARICQLEALALTDELTGLANRRGFKTAFGRELALANRDTDAGGILVMIDLDGFKSVNDLWGHQAGDAYLRVVGQSLQDCVRSTDIVARLGGDEFAILMTHMDEKYGAKRLDKIMKTFSNRWLAWNGARLALRASFGSAVYTRGSNADIVMQSADMRLYAHKSSAKHLITADQ